MNASFSVFTQGRRRAGFAALGSVGLIVLFLSGEIAARGAPPPLAGPEETTDEVRVMFRVAVPDGTDPPLYLAGNLRALGRWRPNGVALERTSDDGIWTATVALPRGEALEYKVTRGSWESVEVNAHGENIANRRLELSDDTEVTIEVADWAEPEPPPPPVELRGRIETHAKVESRFVETARPIHVYLPPKYNENSTRRYRVLYLQDGQNVFAALGHRRASWRADVIVESLIAKGRIDPIIIVAVGNTNRRMAEYTPSRSEKLNAGGDGERYARFLAEELKPFIDRTYRTRPESEYNAIAGSSLGGLVSLYTVWKHPTAFSQCAALSPSLWWNDAHLLAAFENDHAWMRRVRFWVDMGTAEGPSTEAVNPNVKQLRRLASIFDAAALVPGRDYYYFEIQDGKHHETAWSQRFDKVVLFLFGK